MILISIFYIFIFISKEICFTNDISVATNGNNTNTCGKAANPCKTIKYAIKLSSDGDRILVNGTEGNIQFENTSYINLQHNLTILGINGSNAIINCTFNQNRFINLSSTAEIQITLTINKISFYNCNHQNFSAIIIKNAKLVLNNVGAYNSGIFIGNQQSNNDLSSCKAIELSIINSTFENNYLIYPYYRYSAELQNCNIVKLGIFNSNITSSPILTKARDTTVVYVNKVTFKDQGKGVNALFIHTSISNNILISDCNFLNFVTSYNSLLTISIGVSEFLNITGISNILIARSNFINNKCVKSSGGAISILSKRDDPMQGMIKITDCQFLKNHAKTLGGSIYALYAFKLKMNNCSFTNNSAGNGGAVYLNKVATFFAFNLTYIGNAANSGGNVIAKGGALYLFGVTGQFTFGSFSDNYAGGDGDAIYATKCPSISILELKFSSNKNALKTIPRKSILSIRTNSNSNNCSLSISNTVFDGTNYSKDNSFLYSEGNILTKNITLLCSVNNSSNCQMLKPEYPSSSYKYKALNLWCSDVNLKKKKVPTATLR